MHEHDSYDGHPGSSTAVTPFQREIYPNIESPIGNPFQALILRYAADRSLEGGYGRRQGWTMTGAVFRRIPWSWYRSIASEG